MTILGTIKCPVCGRENVKVIQPEGDMAQVEPHHGEIVVSPVASQWTRYTFHCPFADIGLTPR